MREFLERHNITILDTQKRWSWSCPIYTNFTKPNDASLLHEMRHHHEEPLYTIQIPESQLKNMQEFEDHVFNNMKEHKHFNMFQAIMEQREEEKRLRENFPSLQKAYENYSMLLTLCKK